MRGASAPFSALSVGAADLIRIYRACEWAYPREACGLLVGRIESGTALATRIVPARNIAPSDRPDRFEVDPQIRFDLERTLRESGEGERLIGHYHSHPGLSPFPSETDLAMAFEPDLAWLIVAVDGGRALESRAWRLASDGAKFVALDLGFSGPAALPERAPLRAKIENRGEKA